MILAIKSALYDIWKRDVTSAHSTVSITKRMTPAFTHFTARLHFWSSQSNLLNLFLVKVG